MLSKHLKHKILELKLGHKLDQFNVYLVIFILIAIFILAFNALLRPVNQDQYLKVMQLAEQASHPKTQAMALNVLQAQKSRRVEYLKLLNAFQFESTRIQEYPALSLDDE